MTKTIYIVAGSFSYDEESGHWNVRGFTSYDTANQFLGDLTDRIAANSGKLQNFLCELQTKANKKEIEWSEYDRLRAKATARFRELVGDPKVSISYLSEVEYHVEKVEMDEF